MQSEICIARSVEKTRFKVLKSWIGKLVALLNNIGLGAQDRRDREVVLAMDDRLLLDIGVSREELLRNAQKPYWDRVNNC